MLCVGPMYISAMSWLKSPQSRNVWFGLEVICVVMLVLISAMCRMSSGCEGMYMWKIIHGCKGRLLILSI